MKRAAVFIVVLFAMVLSACGGAAGSYPARPIEVIALG